MKKIAIGAMAVCLLTACTNINKDELKQEIKEDLKKEMAHIFTMSPFLLAVRNFLYITLQCNVLP